MNQQTRINPAALPATIIQASILPIFPAGRCRSFVRGFCASNLSSTIRFHPIAAVRAHTIAAKISPNVLHPGQPAANIAAKANGSANTVWEKRTNSKYLRNGSIERFIARSPVPLNAALSKEICVVSRWCLCYWLITCRRTANGAVRRQFFASTWKSVLTNSPCAGCFYCRCQFLPSRPDPAGVRFRTAEA